MVGMADAHKFLQAVLSTDNYFPYHIVTAPFFPKYCLQLGQEEVASNTNLKFGGFYVSHT